MRKSTFTKTALTLMALGVFMTGAMAEDDQSPSASVQYQLNLAPYVKITAESATELSSETTYEADYGQINITSAMTAQFKVISNDHERTFYLQGSCPVAGAKPLYAKSSDPKTNLHLVFTKVGGVAEAADVTGAIAGASAASNKDAISFKVTPTIRHIEQDSDTAITGSWNDTKKQVEYLMPNGTGTYNYTISGQADTNTFSTHDTSGTYQATLTLTATSL